MGWIAITKDKEILQEDKDGRPVQKGEDGELLYIFQYDFGHTVGVDLINGVVSIDFESFEIQDRVYLINPKVNFFICEETNIVAEYRHLKQEIVWARGENGKLLRDENKRPYKVRNDILTPLTWRPIWFTRWTNGIPVKVIGAQTTAPDLQGGNNIKCMVSLFPDGRIGVSM